MQTPFKSKLTELHPNDEYFGCYVSGDYITAIPDGGFVLFDPRRTPKDGDYVVYTYKGILYLRRLQNNLLVNDKNEEPHPLNDDFEFLGTVSRVEITYN